jgi:uncharacterized protein (TIGR03083 family)
MTIPIVRGARARRPALARTQTAELAATENSRFGALVESLEPEHWTLPTDCPGWDVRAMVAHVVGAMDSQVSKREFVHQLRAGSRAAGDRAQVDGINDVQIRERATMGPGDLTVRLADVAPRAATARVRRSRLMRRVSFPQEVGGRVERWTLGFLNDVIYTRDTWMHRVDISRVIGRQVEVTAEHDGVLVRDVVQEWAERHGQPYSLTLTGPAGGVFGSGGDGPPLELDAVEFCRVVSGRGTGPGLLAQPVPF